MIPPVAMLLAAAASAAPHALTLSEALAIARAHQPQLTQARASSEAAQARAGEARAPLLPQLTATASLGRQLSPAGLPAPVTVDGRALDWTVGVSGSQLLWDFGQTSGRWRAAGALARAQQASERGTFSDVALGVRTAFFSARAAGALLTVARETLDNQDRHLTQIEGYVQAGARPDIDLVQARADRASAQVQAIDAENAYDAARAQLHRAMGVTGPIDFSLSDEAAPAVPGEEGPLEALVQEAIAARPELLALREQLRAQQLAVSAARAGYLPAFALSARISDAAQPLSPEGWSWTAAVTATWPLLSGLLTHAQVQEAQADQRGAEAGLEQERQQVQLEVEQARLGVRAAAAALRASDVALPNARERLRLAEGRYQTGAGTILELGDAQLALTAAEAQRVQADYTLASSRAQLLHALGRS